MAFDYSTLKSCGKDVRIADTAIIKNPDLVSIGDHVAIDDYVVISTAAELGDYVHIAPHVSVIGGRRSRLIMHHFSGIAAGTRVVCGSDDFMGSGLTSPIVPAAYHCDVKYTTVTLGKFVVLGTGCVCHPGVTIGEGAVVGSCSLVTKDLEPWTLYLGAPARAVKERPRDKVLDAEARLRADLG